MSTKDCALNPGYASPSALPFQKLKNSTMKALTSYGTKPRVSSYSNTQRTKLWTKRSDVLIDGFSLIFACTSPQWLFWNSFSLLGWTLGYKIRRNKQRSSLSSKHKVRSRLKVAHFQHSVWRARNGSYPDIAPSAILGLCKTVKVPETARMEVVKRPSVECGRCRLDLRWMEAEEYG